MENLNKLINAYVVNEEMSAGEILNDVFQNDLEYSYLSTEESVTLKRQYFNFVNSEESQLNREEQGEFYRRSQLSPEVIANLEVSENKYKNRHPHKKYVEAFVTNISVPKTLEELYDYYLEDNDAQHLIVDANSTGMTNWSVPRWVKYGDIVLFMHAKNANSILTSMRTKIRSGYVSDKKKAAQMEKAIADQLAFHKQYGGKIYAIGKICGKPKLEEIDPELHFEAHAFCDIDSLFLLERPIDISEFNSFMKISSMSSVTPVFGQIYDRLKELIVEKNAVPGYFQYSYSTPFPHNAVNKENWIQLGLEYRLSFSLEIQFRQCYVDYLLSGIGDQKTAYMECTCYKGSNPVTFVDNVIKIDKKLLPVEVKLNIELESNLMRQCEQYCQLDRIILDKKTQREANMRDVINDKVLVIDTYAVYMFNLNNKMIETLYDLENLKSHEDIRELREIVIHSMYE